MSHSSEPTRRPIVVHKYGGSSVGSAAKIQAVADKVVESHRAGARVAVVVSAMGGTTDKLLDLAGQVSDRPSARELDALLSTGERVSTALLAMAIQKLGCEAVSFSGDQCNILTDDRHGQARIRVIEPDRILDTLAAGKIAVVAGFQGMSSQGDVTTLGRGGSDTTAVALAAALDAAHCDIFSDVDGVYSADPRVVESARRLDELGYEEMQWLARYGARVLNADAVEFARRKSITIVARSTFGGSESTIIRNIDGPPADTGFRVAGVAGSDDILRVRYDRSRAAEEAEKLARELSELDVVARRVDGPRVDALVSTSTLPEAGSLADRLSTEYAGGVDVAAELGSVAAVGLGVGSKQEATAIAQRALEQANVPIVGSYRHDEALSYLVPKSAVDAGMRAVHDAFLQAEASAA